MKFSVIDTHSSKISKPKSTPKTPKTPKPAYKQVLKIIDDVGYEIGQDNDLSEKEKIRQWVDLLKSAIPLISSEHQKTREILKDGIQNPKLKDFIRPKIR